MSEPHEAPEEIHDTIAAHEHDVANIPKVGEPAEILNHVVEFMAVHDEKSATIGGGVNRIFLKCHTGIVAMEARKELVVVAGNVDDLRALAAFAEQFLNDVVVILRPVNAASESPYIDQVTNKVEFLKLGVSEELE